MVSKIQERYYASGGKPISAKFLGPVLSIDRQFFAEALAAAAPSDPGENKVEQLKGVKFFMTPLPLDWGCYSRWVYIDDRVGWLKQLTSAEFQQAVDCKRKNLPLYRQKYDDIDLLLVADRTFNSGKLYGVEDFRVCNPGFRAIYFLSYPRSIQRVG